MNKTNQNIDRMVDGELDRESERQLLLDCESNDQWRELALAFVESQALRQEIRVLARASHSAAEAEAEATPTNLTPNSSLHTDSERKEDWGAWSLAAAVLLSLGIGYGLGWGWQHSGSGHSEFIANQSSRPNGSESELRRSMPFTVNHLGTHELQQVEIPLLKATDLGPDWQQRLQAQSSDRIVEEMRRQGLNLRQERTLTPVRLSNGQRVVVPVDYFYEHPYQ